jgi:hypothetical protein
VPPRFGVSWATEAARANAAKTVPRAAVRHPVLNVIAFSTRT